MESLEAEDKVEAESRIENIDELVNKAAAYEEDCQDRGEEASLSGFLEEVALVADIDSLDEDQDYVVLMTLHSAKGLEFPHVYLAGMEDGLFPSYMTITSDDNEDLEEERRLCYVGITRAEEKLTLTCARRRMVRGETQFNKMSRFIKEIPMELIDTEIGRSRKEHRSRSRIHILMRRKRSAHDRLPPSFPHLSLQERQQESSHFPLFRREARFWPERAEAFPIRWETGCAIQNSERELCSRSRKAAETMR